MINILYSKTGKAYSDYEARDVLLKAIHNNEDIITSTSCISDIIDSLIELGYFEEKDIEIIDNYPRIYPYNKIYNSKEIFSLSDIIVEETFSLKYKKNRNFIISKDYVEKKPLSMTNYNEVMKIVYHPKYEAIPDHKVRDMILKAYHNKENLYVSNGIFATMADWLHRAGFINATRVKLVSDFYNTHEEINPHEETKSFFYSFYFYDTVMIFESDANLCFNILANKTNDDDMVMRKLSKDNIHATRDILKRRRR